MSEDLDAMLNFVKSKFLSIGVELEIQLIDSSTLDLTPRSPQILERVGESSSIQPEILQSMLEVISRPSLTVHEVSNDLKVALQKIFEVTQGMGVELACAGTHPTAKHWERQLYPSERFHQLIDRNQFISRRLMVFGIHIHIGVPSGEVCIAIMNEFAYELPILLALSASSPFWEGLDTGLASSRITFFESIPTGGHPYQVNSWNDFTDLISVLKKSRAINSIKDIWWDMRPRPTYGTLEIRVCDGLPTLEENMAVAAFAHCLASHYQQELLLGRVRPTLPGWWVRENKWRASRHGISADLVTDVEGNTESLRSYAFRLINQLNPHFEKYGYEKYRDVLIGNLNGYTSYSRQKQIFEETGDLKDVTRLLIDEMTSSLRV